MISIAKRYGFNDARPISQLLIKQGIRASTRNWLDSLSNEEQQELWRQHLQKTSKKQLAIKYNVNSTTMKKALDMLSQKNDMIIVTTNYQKYNINRNYFKKIDTHEKAYILGFLYADGSIRRNKHGVNGFECQVSEVDKDMLEKICTEMNTPVERIEKRKGQPFFNKRQDRQYISKDSVRLKIEIKEIGEDLVTLGCLPQKSLILKYPSFKQVPLEFQGSFIRGYFDGDGSLIYDKQQNRYAGLVLLGTEDFLVGVVDFLQLDLQPKYSKRDNVWSIRINNVKNICLFYQKCCKDSSIFLIRKHEKFQEFFASIKERGYDEFGNR